MKKMFIFLAVLFMAMGFSLGSFHTDVAAIEADSQGKSIYYCPMHPHVTSDHKGSCPICGMDLVKKEPADKEMSKAPSVMKEQREARQIIYYRNPMNPTVTSPVPAKDSMGMDYVPVFEENNKNESGVTISLAQQQMIGVKRELVKKRPLEVHISSVGKVAYDPDLYVAQEEYIQALKMADASRESSSLSIREQSQGLLTSAEKKLLLLGMSSKEISLLQDGASAQDNLYLPGASGKAWIYMTVYEYEMGLIKQGQEVVVDTLAFPGELFKGKIVSLSPVFNPESRSISARIEVNDPDGKLKPEMFVNARISIDLGEKLAISEDAVMDSGSHKIAYVVFDNTFTARDVTLGPKAGGYYEVVSGLNEGEEVVTSGNFLIDSESKMKAAW